MTPQDEKANRLSAEQSVSLRIRVACATCGEALTIEDCDPEPGVVRLTLLPHICEGPKR